jgi:hypothetical protein
MGSARWQKMRIAIVLLLVLAAQVSFAQRSYTIGTTQRQPVVPPEYYQKTRGNILAPKTPTVATAPAAARSLDPDRFGSMPPHLRARYGLDRESTPATIDRTRSVPTFGPVERLYGKVTRWISPTMVEIETLRPQTAWVTESTIREEGFYSGSQWVPPRTTRVGNYQSKDVPVLVQISGIAPNSIAVDDPISWQVRWADTAKTKGVLSQPQRRTQPPAASNTR